MAWERRGNRRYYYRSIRRGRRVVKQYFGRGPLAEQAAREDAERRAARERERQAMLAEMRGMQEVARLTDQVETDARLLLDATMLASGLHRPNYGPWRRKRAKQHEADRG